MAQNFVLQDLINENSLQQPVISEVGSKINIRFKLTDVLSHLAQIQLIWSSLVNKRAKPIAKTFLGRITSISYDK